MTAIVDLALQSSAFYLSLVFVVSLMVGSFLNVVIYRLPIMMERSWQQEYQGYFDPDTEVGENETFNLIKPDSTCPKCQHKIRAWENIPVISYLFLRGRCSGCGTAISVRYPLVELFTALACTLAAWHFGPTAQGVCAVFITYILIACIFIDLDKMLLPDQLTLPLMWLGLLVSTQALFVGTSDAIWGAAVGYLSLWSVYWLFKLVTGKEGMGYGDFKLLAALGAFTGWQGLPIIIILSSCVGAVIGITLMIVQKKDSTLAIPFGPYLAIAGWLTLLYKDNIITGYMTWVFGA
ncbi:prepilin peptidase [Alteromonas aestuariivivens]|uniref:Prepilin leader peptidase/N-methyltransferase n=1 Tax=Alteromonas aestuariivivens TaxID=1938339 RepID=A0A3D8MEQ0_9ALTE|nr:A24 family peptidase [Alteromonas aestuariivivens]RDV29080.1 prepilin peptidase [Alteromonas aestuariivivens]